VHYTGVVGVSAYASVYVIRVILDMSIHIIRSCLWWVLRASYKCPGRQCIYRCVCYTGVFGYQHAHLRTHSLQVVEMRACMRNLFIVVRGRGWGGSASLWRTLVTWRGGLFLTGGEIGMLSVSSISFDTGGSACVYTHTHTRTTYGVLGCEPSGRDETPGGSEESNLSICVLVYMYKVQMCIYMLGGEMRSWTICFSSLSYFSSRERKAKNVNVIPISQIHTGFEGIDP